jgi:hypothetical protein
MNHFSFFVSYIKKTVFGFWGLTTVDMINFIDLGFLDLLNTDLKHIFTFLGFIYFAIQIPFKVIKLIHTKKMDELELKIKNKELKQE